VIFTKRWFPTGSDREESSQILKGAKARQHPPESQGGDDRNPHDRAQAGDGAQIISAEPSSGSVLKFSSRRTQVRQRTSRSTISAGLKGASFCVADTR
jgi:hypothetical protein